TMGAPLIGEVRLVTGPDKNGVFKVLPLTQFTANMSGTDGQMVDIIYTGAKMNTVKNSTIKNVRLAILPKDGKPGSTMGTIAENYSGQWKPWKTYNAKTPINNNTWDWAPDIETGINAGAGGDWIISDRAFNLKVVETWPKVTLKMTGGLSLAFPDRSATITATTPNGIGDVTAMNLLLPANTIMQADQSLAGLPAGTNPVVTNIRMQGNSVDVKLVPKPSLPKNRKVTLTAKTGTTAKTLPEGGWIKIEGYKHMFLPDNTSAGSKAVYPPKIPHLPRTNPESYDDAGSLLGSSLKAGGLPALAVTVAAANALPKAKMAKATVPILTKQNAKSDTTREFTDLERGVTYAQIVSNDKKVSNADFWAQIDRVEIRDKTSKNKVTAQGAANIKATYMGSGKIRLEETALGIAKSGSLQMSMNVYFKGVTGSAVGNPAPLAVDFKISAPLSNALKPTTKAQTVNVSVKPIMDYLANEERIKAYKNDTTMDPDKMLNAAERAAMETYESIEGTFRLATIPVAANVDNLTLDTWGIASVGGKLQVTADTKTKSNGIAWANYIGNHAETARFAVEVRPGAAGNTIELWADKEKLKDFVDAHNTYVGAKVAAKTNMKYTLKISDAKSGVVPVSSAAADSRFRDKKDKLQSFNITLNLSKGVPSFKVTLAKKRLDITNPEGFQDATVKLTNAASDIAYVKLYEQRFSDAKKKVLYDLGNVESKDFEAVVKGPQAFQIVRKPGALPPPNIKQKLSVEIGLKNGQVLRSWTYDSTKALAKQWADKPITMNPQQPGYKATYSRNNVTLHRSSPLLGEAVGLSLTPTAANPNVSIGAVGINPASVKLLEEGGLRLEQSGGGEWTIYFANDKTPKVVDKNGKVQLKSGSPVAPKASYKVGMQIWPEGAYKWQTDPRQPDGYARDKSGNKIPVALTNPANGKAASKPVTVNVTVKIQ
ncbi:MAG: hypothetical protein FWG03_09210, partial [Clostridiales bacterium]|nr:hypothetical protein [Clostridiales bacterium]